MDNPFIYTSSEGCYMRKALGLVSLVVAVSVGGCKGSESEQKKVVITGSSTVAPVMLEIAKRFESKNPGVRIDVQTGGSSRGIADAREGRADIGMISRSLKSTESDLKGFAVAYDGICIIVHKSNPIKTLTDEQTVKIYKGEVSNWSEVGGSDAKITVVNKAEGRSSLELFLKHFGLKNKDIKADVVIGDNEQGVKTVAGNPNSVGYVSVGTAEYDASQGVAIKPLPSRGVEASTKAVLDGRFPLRRTLHVVTKGAPQGVVKDIIDFAQSAEVHDLIQGQYFVPITP